MAKYTMPMFDAAGAAISKLRCEVSPSLTKFSMHPGDWEILCLELARSDTRFHPSTYRGQPRFLGIDIILDPGAKRLDMPSRHEPPDYHQDFCPASKTQEILRCLVSGPGIYNGGVPSFMLSLRTLLQSRTCIPFDPDSPCDVASVILSPPGASLVADIFHTFLRHRGIEAVGGGGRYGAYIAPLVACRGGDDMSAFVVRDEAKDHGHESSIDQAYSPDHSPLLSPGRKVAIVDGVGDKSLLSVIREVTERGCEIISILVLLGKDPGVAYAIQYFGYPYRELFKIEKNGLVLLA